MAKNKLNFDYYAKWDIPEEVEVAFEMVKIGAWDLDHFEQWVSQVCLEEYRNNCGDESL